VEYNVLHNLELKDNSNVAVIGGGPAGSFFTYFALDFAQRVGTNINIDIYEAKDFTCAGPSGCNHCGGIVSESLVQMLSAEGIVLPPNAIRKGIET
jgi:flavin-dependent dehydrogenase